jgi:hypothetical protein
MAPRPCLLGFLAALALAARGACAFNARAYADGIPLGQNHDEDEAGQLSAIRPLYHTNVLPRPRAPDKKYVLPKWKPERPKPGSVLPATYSKYFPDSDSDEGGGSGDSGAQEGAHGDDEREERGSGSDDEDDDDENDGGEDEDEKDGTGAKGKHRNHGAKRKHRRRRRKQHGSGPREGAKSRKHHKKKKNMNNKTNGKVSSHSGDALASRPPPSLPGIENDDVTFKEIGRHSPPSSSKACVKLCGRAMVRITLPSARLSFWCQTHYPDVDPCTWVVLSLTKRFREWAGAAKAHGSSASYSRLLVSFQGIRDATCHNLCNPDG